MPKEPIKELKGRNGQLEVYPDKVIIKRKGAIAKMTQGLTKGDKTIPINQITSIQVRHGGYLTTGYIQFSVRGGNENAKGLLSATKDENSINFNKDKNEKVDKIKKYIEKQMSSSNQPSKTNKSIAKELRELKKLADEGVLTEEEFQKEKDKLLSEK